MTSPAGDGPVGDEARRLIAAVQAWAQRAVPSPPSGHGGPECEWCPVCQFASILRGEYPELAERVTEAGVALSTAFRALLETANAAKSEAGTDTPDPAPRVQRIRLGDPVPTESAPTSDPAPTSNPAPTSDPALTDPDGK